MVYKIEMATWLLLLSIIGGVMSFDKYEVAEKIANHHFIGSRKRIVLHEKVATVIRLTFHDCIGAGKCDGCLDINAPFNKGLKPIFDKLNDHYSLMLQDYPDMSRADYYVLTCSTGMDLSSAREGMTNFSEYRDRTFMGVRDFIAGRMDCPTSPQEDETNEPSPNSTFNHAELIDYFLTHFGLSEDETTTLMGIHTMGKAKLENTGYHGRWVRNNKRMNNCLYKRYGKQYEQNMTKEGKFQWINNKGEMMLPCDIAMKYEFTVNENGEASCNACAECCYSENKNCDASIVCDNCCPIIESTKEMIKRYRRSNSAWMQDFRPVMAKVTSIPPPAPPSDYARELDMNFEVINTKNVKSVEFDDEKEEVEKEFVSRMNDAMKELEEIKEILNSE